MEVYSNWFLKYQALICPYQETICIFLLEFIPILFFNWQALICSLLSTNVTPIHVEHHKTSSILLLSDFFQINHKLPEFISPLLSADNTPIPVQYHKTSCILLLWNLFQWIYKLPNRWFPPCWAPMQPQPLFNITKWSVFYCLVIYSNWFINF